MFEQVEICYGDADDETPVLRSRGSRCRVVKGKTIPKRRVLAQIREGQRLYPEALVEGGYWRPQTRADCLPGGGNAERPCPFVGCKYHLYLDVHPVTGSIKLNFPDLEPEELKNSCVLDLAARGGLSLEESGDLLNLVRERVRQIELEALDKLTTELDQRDRDAFLEHLREAECRDEAGRLPWAA